MLRPLNINVYNNTPRANNAKTPAKTFSEKSANISQAPSSSKFRKPVPLLNLSKLALEDGDENGKEVNADPDMRFSYRPVKDLYETTLARAKVEFVVLKDDDENEGPYKPESFNIFADLDEKE